MTCCHVRVAPAGSPAFQYTRRKVEAECGSFCVLVAGGDDAIGFVLVAGLEGFLFLGGEVFAVINSPRTEEHTVALFHVLLHVMNMNQPEPISSASSGRGCTPVCPDFPATETSTETHCVFLRFPNEIGWRRGSESNQRFSLSKIARVLPMPRLSLTTLRFALAECRETDVPYCSWFKKSPPAQYFGK